MLTTCTIVCPECGAEDTTNVELDEFDIYVTTQCVECTNPYAIRVRVSVNFTPYKLVKTDA